MFGRFKKPPKLSLYIVSNSKDNSFISPLIINDIESYGLGEFEDLMKEISNSAINNGTMTYRIVSSHKKEINFFLSKRCEELLYKGHSEEKLRGFAEATFSNTR